MFYLQEWSLFWACWWIGFLPSFYRLLVYYEMWPINFGPRGVMLSNRPPPFWSSRSLSIYGLALVETGFCSLGGSEIGMCMVPTVWGWNGGWMLGYAIFFVFFTSRYIHLFQHSKTIIVLCFIQYQNCGVFCVKNLLHLLLGYNALLDRWNSTADYSV